MFTVQARPFSPPTVYRSPPFLRSFALTGSLAQATLKKYSLSMDWGKNEPQDKVVKIKNSMIIVQ